MKDLSGYTVLVIGGGIMQLPVLNIIRDRGGKTICFDGNPKALGSRNSDQFYTCDISDKYACVRLAQKITKESRIHGVLTVGTDFSLTVSEIATNLGLISHSQEAAHLASDKAHMRETLGKAGISIPWFYTINLDDKIPMDLTYPLVVKPVDNMGARGIRLVESQEQLSNSIKIARDFSRSGRVLLEEFIEGPEFSLDGVLTEEGLIPFGLARRRISRSPFFVETGHSFPSVLAEDQVNALWDIFSRSTKALGLSRGGVKADLKWGKTGPVVGEIAGRLSGGFMSGWTYPRFAGRSAIQAAINIAVGLPARTAEESFVPKRVQEAGFFSIPGTIHSVAWIPKFPDSWNAEFFLRAQKGKKTRLPENNIDKWGNVIVSLDLAELEEFFLFMGMATLDLNQGDKSTLSFLEGKGDQSWFLKSSRELTPTKINKEHHLEDPYGNDFNEVFDSWTKLAIQEGWMKEELLQLKRAEITQIFERGGPHLLYWWIQRECKI